MPAGTLRAADPIAEGRAGGDEEEGRRQPKAYARHLARE